MQSIARQLLKTPRLAARHVSTAPKRPVRDPRQLYKRRPQEHERTLPAMRTAPPTLAPSLQPEFDHLLSNLDQAHKQKSLLQAHSHWTSLQSRGLLAHVPESQFTALQSLLDALPASLLASAAESDPAREAAKRKVVRDVCDLMVVLAVQGESRHLAQFMRMRMKESRIEDVLGVWKQYESQVPPRPSSSSGGDTYDPAEVAVRRVLSIPVLQAYAAQQDYRSAIIALFKRRCYISLNHTFKVPTTPSDRFLQVVAAVIEIVKGGATRDLISKFTRGNDPSFAIHLYETLITGSQSGEHPWVRISQQRPSDAELGDWATRPLFHMGEAAFRMFAAEFARCHRVDLAQKVTDDMAALGLRIPDAMLNTLLDAYIKARNLDGAGRIYALLNADGRTPDLFAHTTLINGLFQEGAVDEAMELFGKAKELFGEDGINATAYNAVVHGLAINGRVEDAEAVVELMRTSESVPKPDTITYNILLRHYGRKADAANFVRTLQGLTSAGLSPDVYTFTTIVDTLLQSNRPDAVKRMLDVMDAAKIPANTATYTAIIDCLIRRKGEGNVRAALNLVEKMEAYGIPANEVTFTSLLAGVTRDDTLPSGVQKQLGEDIMDRMTARGMEPNRITRNFILLGALQTDGREGTDRAMRIWREAVSEKGGPEHLTSSTYHILLDGLAKNERWADVREVIEYINQSGRRPSGTLAKLVGRLSREITLKGFA